MACKECRERREKLIEAALEGRLMAAAGHAIKGAAEMVGLKPKTASPENEARPVVEDDPETVELADHRKKSRAPRS